VHREQCKTIVHLDNKISSPQGIGGDDRCGVFIIMNLVKDLHCSVLLCEDEEKGCVGAKKFVNAKKLIDTEDGDKIEVKYVEDLGVNYMIEFDRKGHNDAVFYHCGNEDFIDFVEDITNFKFANGSVSDISVLMPEAKLSAVNLSCGYYNAHTTTEFVLYDQMEDTIAAASALIKTECDKPFEYIRKETPHYSSGSLAGSYYQNYMQRYGNKHTVCGDFYGNFLDDPSVYNDEPLANIAMNDKELELEVVVYDKNLSEQTFLSTGETKAECWMTLFLENPNLCFNDIVDYTWS
jgi:hypothetical protein